MEKIKLGRVGVDSGQLMITDPCYLKDFVSNEYIDIRRYKNKNTGEVLEYGHTKGEHDFTSYNDIIPKHNKSMNDLLASGEWEKLPHPHVDDNSYSYMGACMVNDKDRIGGELNRRLGVTFTSGYGDGVYDVYAYVVDTKGFGTRVSKVEIILIDETGEV
mgnify:CR=1 FL=1|tara:strand:+ start:78 stop:557 length:480 start_codon:yes stop_codon:yes gene_type:complete